MSAELQIVNEFKKVKNYAGLAHFFSIGERFGYTLSYFSACKAAKNALCEGGVDAVNAVIEELDAIRRGWHAGCDDLSEILVSIGDSKAVPILKRLLDDGTLHPSPSIEESVRSFIAQWPDLQPATEMVMCLYCEKTIPINETHGYGDNQGREWRLCESCWPHRASWLYKIQDKNSKPYRLRS